MFLIFFIRRNLDLYRLEDLGWRAEDVKKVAESIQQRVAEDEKYNIVLLSESKDPYGLNYRYFLSTMSNPTLKFEDHHLAEKLFIIDEEKKEEKILNLPLYEIVVFPHKNVIEKYQFNPGPEITVLGAPENNYNNE